MPAGLRLAECGLCSEPIDFFYFFFFHLVYFGFIIVITLITQQEALGSANGEQLLYTPAGLPHVSSLGTGCANW